MGFTITAVLLTVLLRGFTDGLASSDRSSAYAGAVLAAQSALDAAGLTMPLQEGAEGEANAGRFHVVTRIRRYDEGIAADPSALYVVPYEVLVDVSWREGRRERSVSLRSVRLGPQLAR